MATSTKLGELTTLISSGATPLGGATNYAAEGEVMLIRSQNVHMYRLVLDDVAFVTHEVADRMARTYLQPGDVLLNITGASIGRVACFRIGVRANVNQHVCVIRPRAGTLDSGFLAHYLASPSFQAQIDQQQHGGTRQALTFAQISDFPVPNLALEVQRRIAAILDKADGIRRKRREVVKLADEFLKSAFLEMFGDPVGNPRGWRKLPLSVCISAIDPGWSVGGEGRPLAEGERGVLKISAVTSGRFRPSEAKVVEGPIPPSVIAPKRGDLLFSRANTRELVAATCLVDADCPNLFLPDKLWRIRPEATIATTEYLRFLLAHEEFREKIRKQATGSSGSMLNVSQAKVLEVVAPMPPLELQARFGRLVWRHFAADARLREAASDSDRLFASLVERAFEGGL